MFLGRTGKYNSSGSKVDGSASSKTRAGNKITFSLKILSCFYYFKEKKNVSVLITT
jgi:hypothetical protein